MDSSHSGEQDQLIDQATEGIFQVAISLSRTGATTAHLVLHATACASPDRAAQLPGYFERLGLIHFEGLCPYFLRNCYQKVIALIRPYYPGAEYRHLATDRVNDVVKMFDEGFAGNEQQVALLRALIDFKPIPLSVESSSDTFDH